MADFEYTGRNKHDIIASVRREDNIVQIEMHYPASDRIECVEVGMTHVRAADSIRILYDFDRDGWIIQQASTFSWAADDTVLDEDWQEVAFVQAWGRATDHTPADPEAR